MNLAGFSIGPAAEMDKTIGHSVDDFCRATRLRMVKKSDEILCAMAKAFQIEFEKLYLYVLLRAYVRELKFYPETAPYIDDMARRLGVNLGDLELYLYKHTHRSSFARRPSWETAEGRIAALEAEALSVGY